MLEPIKPEEITKIVSSQINQSSKTAQSTTPKWSDEAPCAGGCGKIIPTVKLVTATVPDYCPACLAEIERKEKEQEEADRKEWMAGRVRRCRAESGLTAREAEKTFENFTATAGNSSALAAARSVIDKGNLVLVGEYGIGKTHLALAITNHHVNNGRTVRFFPMARLLAEARATISTHGSEAELIDRLRTAPLIIDDFGSTKLTEWSLAFMDFLIDEWYRHQAQGLVITTNLNLGKVAENVSGRIASRLSEMARCVEIRDKDRRIFA